MQTLEHPMLLFRTSVSQKLLKKLLKQGISSAFAFFGVLWLAECLTPLAGIEDLGIWRWVAGGGVLGASCFSYRLVLQYKFRPEILRVTEEYLILSRNDAELFRIPWTSVEEMRFLEGDATYGIAFSITPSTGESPILLLQKLQSKKYYGVDLFLPFFSKSSFHLIQNWNEEKNMNPSTACSMDKK